MAQGDLAERIPEQHPLDVGQLQRNWGWLLALGILFLGLGAVGLGMTFAVTIASVLVFGTLLIIGGGAQIFQAFTARGWRGILLHVLMAAVYVAAGIFTVADPLAASGILTLVLSAMLFIAGVLRIGIALQFRHHRGWGWALASGILSLILGTLILAGWPTSALWVIGMFVALELLFNGAALVGISWVVRRAGTERHAA